MSTSSHAEDTVMHDVNFTATPPADDTVIPDVNFTNTAPTNVVIPPDDVRQSIEHTADFIYRKGGDMETKMRERAGDEAKFSFLMPDDQFHAYFAWYLQTLDDDKDVAPSERLAGPMTFFSDSLLRTSRPPSTILPVPRELRNAIYHELWRLTPLVNAMLERPLVPSQVYGNMAQGNLTWLIQALDSEDEVHNIKAGLIYDDAFEVFDGSVPESSYYEVNSRVHFPGFPLWLLSSKPFLEEGLEQLRLKSALLIQNNHLVYSPPIPLQLRESSLLKLSTVQKVYLGFDMIALTKPRYPPPNSILRPFYMLRSSTPDPEILRHLLTTLIDAKVTQLHIGIGWWDEDWELRYDVRADGSFADRPVGITGLEVLEPIYEFRHLKTLSFATQDVVAKGWGRFGGELEDDIRAEVAAMMKRVAERVFGGEVVKRSVVLGEDESWPINQYTFEKATPVEDRS